MDQSLFIGLMQFAYGMDFLPHKPVNRVSKIVGKLIQLEFLRQSLIKSLSC